MSEMKSGQRWLSDSEPELGLGMVLECENGVVEIVFPATEEVRRYAADSAPLRRVIFSVNDEILTHDGETLVVLRVSQQDGVLTYHAENRSIEEAELSDSMVLNQPFDRLLAGITDSDYEFRLRREAIIRHSEIMGSPLRGYLGCRADLIPHQMSIVSEVAKRLRPRVLLADEVGLGKTIEACMIMHRLHLTGRADRVLIIVPEPLVHQWFVELLRRFNMLFSLFDEDRCKAIQAHHDVNPFLDSQWVIVSQDFLTQNPSRAEQARQAGWDMLIVDEAHHLAWSEAEVSAEYALVESLAARTESVLLLTATPQQLGPEGHFARLKLLDPSRFSNLKSYLQESSYYEEVAELVLRLRAGGMPTVADISCHEATSQRVQQGLKSLRAGDESARRQLVDDLLDSFGPGRVMFRNTRDHLSGFPLRRAHLSAVDSEQGMIDWLETLIRRLKGEKILLIAQTRSQIESTAQALQSRLQLKLALFHEDLTLLQRDRNAAYFSEPDGAQILLCSEIGSEGRNFQFAHHLVMFDLPADPELLEQRIGRLDRIGQTGEIHIHVPYQQGTQHEVLAKWYSEGLNAFEKNLHGATQIYQACKPLLDSVSECFSQSGLQKLIAFSLQKSASVRSLLMNGQDQLLALQSFRSKDAKALIEGISEVDAKPQFQKFFTRLLDQLGVSVDDLGNRSYLLKTGNLVTELGGDIPEEGLPITFDRQRALSREDIRFMSQDHPMLRNAMDVFLASETGNSSFGMWQRGAGKAILLECYFILEVVSPSRLGAQRYLAARPIRVVVNHQLENLSNDPELLKAQLQPGNLMQLLSNKELKQKLLPSMLSACEKVAAKKSQSFIAKAQQQMQQSLSAELSRLQDLSRLNDLVTDAELSHQQQQICQIHTAISNARIRLDSLRLIWQT